LAEVETENRVESQDGTPGKARHAAEGPVFTDKVQMEDIEPIIHEMTSLLGSAVRNEPDPELDAQQRAPGPLSSTATCEGHLGRGTIINSPKGTTAAIVVMRDVSLTVPANSAVATTTLSVAQAHAKVPSQLSNATMSTLDTTSLATSTTPPGASSSSSSQLTEEATTPAKRPKVPSELTMKLHGQRPIQEIALERHAELRKRRSAMQETLQRKQAETQEAKVARDAAKVRTHAAEELAKPELARLEEALSTAKKWEAEVRTEMSKEKLLFSSFVELQSFRPKMAKTSVDVLKPHLKLIGVDSTTLDALSAVLAKKCRSMKDKKVLSSIEDAFAAYGRTKEAALTKRQADLKRAEEDVVTAISASQARACEVAAFDEALAAREREQKACQDQAASALCELTEHERSMTEEGLLRFNSSGSCCSVCCNNVPADASVLLGCGHGWYCLECVNRFVEARLETGAAGDVPCPECKIPISEDALCAVLPKKTIFRLYARNVEQKAVASGAVPRSCPTPNCQMRQTFNEGDSGRLICPICVKESCWLCGTQPYHDGQTCEQNAKRERVRGQKTDEDLLFEWMEQTGTRQCPTCHMATTKENLERQKEQRSECHKMLCRNCGTKFCFKCLSVLSDTYTCGCTKNKHGFVDPHTGEVMRHLQRGKPKAKPKVKVATG